MPDRTTGPQNGSPTHPASGCPTARRRFFWTRS